MAPPVEITVSKHFIGWLHEERISLALTTYQANRLFLIGLKPNGDLSIFERLFDRPMGLHATTDTLHLATRYQLWRFENALPPGQIYQDYDRIYVPRCAHTTGDVDAHDVELDRDGRLIFVNTSYSCLAGQSERYSFRPVWRPRFISRLAPEDRCHLNGLAMESGLPAYVTTVSRSDVVGGWRDRRHAGGCLIDIRSNDLLLTEMSMPHSPRCHAGRVWLLEAGKGELGYLDRKRGAFEPVAFCPGFLRGLAFYKNHALVGLSKPRRERAFQGLELEQRLAAKDCDALCGVHVIDLASGNVVHWLRIEGVVGELYDVKILPGVRMPMALGFKSDEIQRLITLELPEGPVFEALAQLPDVSTTAGLGMPGLPAETDSPPEGSLPQPPAPVPGPPEPEDNQLLSEARLARRDGKPVEAEVLYQRLLSSHPQSARGHYGLANLLVTLNRLQEAIPHYEAVLDREPGHAKALLNLGAVHYQLGHAETAIDCYRRALALDDRLVQGYRNLAGALRSEGRSEEAVTLYEQALRRNPLEAELHSQAGMTFLELGSMDRALEHLRRAVALSPGLAEAHNHLGGILALLSQATGDDGEALAHYRRAVELKPDLGAAHKNIGVILEDRGEMEAATESYRCSLKLEPDPVLELHTATLFPFVAPSNQAIDAYRASLKGILDDFMERRLRLDLASVQCSRGEPPLHWAYQGRDDHALKARYAALFAATPFPRLPIAATTGARIHVGFVASLGHEALFMRCMAGVINRLPAEKFRLTVLCPRPGESVVRQYLAHPAVGYVALPLRFDHAIGAIRDAGCDILYYWETGTDSTNYFLPFCRLAAVQCTGWGWPVTSGAPEMDYYISGRALTTPESDAHFTEKLVRLASLPTHFERLPLPAEAGPRDSIGLPERAHLYVCLQNLRKVHPDLDPPLGDILREDPHGVAVFVSDAKPVVTELLKRRWQGTLPDVLDRILVLPRLSGMDYCRLVMHADVVLDTLHFGGANTAYDALGAGKPIVTLPNAYQRGRYTHACYQVMGIQDCIASTPQQYVEIALHLGTDPAWRQEVSARIAAESGALFNCTTPVSELGDFFEEAVANAAS